VTPPWRFLLPSLVRRKLREAEDFWSSNSRPLVTKFLPSPSLPVFPCLVTPTRGCPRPPSNRPLSMKSLLPFPGGPVPPKWSYRKTAQKAILVIDPFPTCASSRSRSFFSCPSIRNVLSFFPKARSRSIAPEDLQVGNFSFLRVPMCINFLPYPFFPLTLGLPLAFCYVFFLLFFPIFAFYALQL